jgi:hypothetical protein
MLPLQALIDAERHHVYNKEDLEEELQIFDNGVLANQARTQTRAAFHTPLHIPLSAHTPHTHTRARARAAAALNSALARAAPQVLPPSGRQQARPSTSCCRS